MEYAANLVFLSPSCVRLTGSWEWTLIDKPEFQFCSTLFILLRPRGISKADFLCMALTLRHTSALRSIL